jgi:hypothetical protein
MTKCEAVTILEAIESTLRDVAKYDTLTPLQRMQLKSSAQSEHMHVDNIVKLIKRLDRKAVE